MSLKNLGILTQAISTIDAVNKGSADLHVLSDVLQGISKDALVSASSVAGLSAEQLACALSAKGLTSAEIASNLALNGYSKAAVYAALQTLGLKDEQIDAIIANLSFASSTDVATKSTNKLSLAFKGLAKSIGIPTKALGALLGTVAVISVVAAGVKMYNEYIQDLVDKAREAASAWSESNSSINSYVDRINELRTALDSGTLSEEEAYQAKSELLSIQQSLSESYGDQVNGIDLINGSLERQIALIEELSKAEANRLLNSNRTGIAKAEKEMERVRSYALGSIYNESANKELIESILAKYSDNITVNRDTYSPTQSVAFVGTTEELFKAKD